MSIGSVTYLLIALVSTQNRALSSAQSDTLYFSSGSQLLVITRKPSTDETVACDVLTKGSTAYDIQIKEASTSLVDTSKEFMKTLVKNCREFNYFGLDGIKELARKRQLLIYPGTNWCGTGNKAKDDSDLGEYNETDKCCRAHDKCDIYISAFQTKYDLFNFALYSVMSCDCDKQLWGCLISVAESTTAAINDKSAANSVGNIFFNIISPKCLQQVYPRVCTTQGTGITSYTNHQDTDNVRERNLAWFYRSSSSYGWMPCYLFDDSFHFLISNVLEMIIFNFFGRLIRGDSWIPHRHYFWRTIYGCNLYFLFDRHRFIPFLDQGKSALITSSNNHFNPAAHQYFAEIPDYNLTKT